MCHAPVMCCLQSARALEPFLVEPRPLQTITVDLIKGVQASPCSTDVPRAPSLGRSSSLHAPLADRGPDGGITSLVWPGNAWGSPRRK